MYQERMEAERLAVWGRSVEAETEELERQKALERLDAAMARGQDAEHEMQEGEAALWHQGTQETLKAIRDEAVRVEAARTARGHGVRLAEDDGLDQAADSVRRHASLRLP